MGPCVLKPNTLGGSFLTEWRDQLSMDGLRAYSERVALYDSSFLAQQRIVGKEYTCGVLIDGHSITALPVARIDNPSGFFGYHQKIQPGSYSVDFDVNKDLKTHIVSISRQIAREIGFHTFARLDFIVDDQQRIYFFEVNLVPGLTTASIYPKMLEKAGFDLRHLIRLAVSNETCHRHREAMRKAETSRVRYGLPLEETP
ncbi:hypothetical protein NKH92_30615 [Mesorhizobium sp. M0871]|uniref:hypothetical protein n=1 Tax=Mesorhizobium sp. M0871 TaxID=2957017 RepID=UPI00333D1112